MTILTTNQFEPLLSAYTYAPRRVQSTADSYELNLLSSIPNRFLRLLTFQVWRVKEEVQKTPFIVPLSSRLMVSHSPWQKNSEQVALELMLCAPFMLKLKDL